MRKNFTLLAMLFASMSAMATATPSIINNVAVHAEAQNSTVVSTKTYSDKLSTSITVGDGDGVVANFENSGLVVNEMSDGTYSVTFKDVRVGENKDALGDITINGAVKYKDDNYDDREILTIKKPVKFTVDDKESAYYGVEFTVDLLYVYQYGLYDDSSDDLIDKAFAQLVLSGEKDGSDIDVTADYGSDPDNDFWTYESHGKAKVTYNGTTTEESDAVVVVEEYENDVYKLTFKDLSLGGTRLGDISISNVTISGDDEDGDGKADNIDTSISTSDSYATWSNVNPGLADYGITEDGEVELSDFAGNGVYDIDKEKYNTLALNFKLAYGDSNIAVEFGYIDTAINGVANSTAAGPQQIFTLDGVKMESLKKGINIVRNADGKTIKVIKR